MKKVLFFIATLVFASTVSAQTWTNPASTPTGGNTATPINEGGTLQTKTGSLGVASFTASLDSRFAQRLGVGMVPVYTLDVNGDTRATGFYYASDRRLKSDIQPLKGSLANILKLQGVSFIWKKDQKQGVGLIAQDVAKVYPNLVNTDAEGMQAVQYGNLVAPLIEAVKEQQQQIDLLKAEIETLKARQ